MHLFSYKVLTLQEYIRYLDYDFEILSQVMRVEQFLGDFHIRLQLTAQVVHLVNLVFNMHD